MAEQYLSNMYKALGSTPALQKQQQQQHSKKNKKPTFWKYPFFRA